MTQLSRTYSFADQVDLVPSQVESEISNIVNMWNNVDKGITQFSTLVLKPGGGIVNAGLITFKNSAATLTSLTGYSSNNFIVQGDSTNGVNIDGNGGNIALGATSGSYGSGSKVVFVPDRTSAPSSNPTGGGILYSESGDLRWRTSGGKVALLSGSKQILQIVTATTTTATTTTSNTYVDTSLTVSITPTFTTSQIFVIASGSLSLSAAGNVAYSIISNGTTNLYGTNAGASANGNAEVSVTMQVLDSPASVSAQTYKVRIKSFGGVLTAQWGNATNDKILQYITAIEVSA